MSESLCIDSPLGGWAMPKAYSGDLRERVIEAVEMGASRHEAADRYEVGVSSAVKWLQRWQERKSAAPQPRGVRLVGHVPLGTWKTITFVAALRHNKMIAPMVVDGPMTGEIFRAYVEQCLVPTLRRNDIVVMDNFRAHKVAGIQEAIEKAR